MCICLSVQGVTQKFLGHDVLKELEKSKYVSQHAMQVLNTAGVQEACESHGRVQ